MLVGFGPACESGEAWRLSAKGDAMAPLDLSALVREDRVHSRVYTDPAIFAWERE